MQSAADKLRKKIERMNESFEPEANEDPTGEVKKNEKVETQTHPHWKYTGFKDTIENAWKPKDPEKVLPRNVDLIDDKQKLKQLDEAIKICTKNLVESRANQPWMYTGPKDTIENMVHVNHVRDWVPKKYVPRNESEESEMSHEGRDDHKKEEQAEKEARKIAKQKHPSVPKFNVKDKTRMYEKEYSDIKKYPWKIKYEDYMEDSQDKESEEDASQRGFSDDEDSEEVKKKKKKAPAKKPEKGDAKKKKNRSDSEVTPDETISAGEDFGF